MLDCHDYPTLNRIWDYVQSGHNGLDMYKCRITPTIVSWVVECPRSKYESMFLLQFGNYVSKINKPASA